MLYGSTGWSTTPSTTALCVQLIIFSSECIEREHKTNMVISLQLGNRKLRVHTSLLHSHTPMETAGSIQFLLRKSNSSSHSQYLLREFAKSILLREFARARIPTKEIVAQSEFLHILIAHGHQQIAITHLLIAHGRRIVLPPDTREIVAHGRRRYFQLIASEIDIMKDKFSKLLLGEDMCGPGKGVCTALAITHLYEHLPPEKKSMWRREMEWLLCVSDHIVELKPSWQTFPDGSKLEDVGKSILETYPRVLESLAFNIVARIDDLLYMDDLTKHSDTLSSVLTVSVIATHKRVSIPYSVPFVLLQEVIR